jgi:cbb3-type cytochrome oxidase maturation protein
MSVIFLVLPLAVVLSGLAVLAFAWSARRGQFDDLETPAWRVLHDDTPARCQPGDQQCPSKRSASDST